MKAESRPEAGMKTLGTGRRNEFRDDLDSVSGERTDGVHEVVTTSQQTDADKAVELLMADVEFDFPFWDELY